MPSLEINREKAIKAIDTVAYIIGPLGNIAVIPQIIKAWESDAPGLAVTTWVLFMFVGLIWLVYAILHKQKPLIVAQAVGISCNFLVVSGWIFNNWIVH
jgi:MtN3 and saliva related transmembrane protein